MLLNVEGINAGYGRLMVLRDISFSLTEGETLAVIGPNGAGKTTLLWALSGHDPAQVGSCHFRGCRHHRAGTAPKVVKLGIGHVLEGMRVFSTLTVEDNLMLGAYGRKIDPAKSLQTVFKYFPVLEKKRKQTRRLPEWRRETDARHRAGPSCAS